jgi:ribosomal protein S18 acetylase RimI-like enzyme
LSPLPEVTIRPARPEDREKLVGPLGDEEFFTDRFARQAAGKGTLLTAWSKEGPVGVVYLWTEAAEEPEIRERLHGVPLLNHVEVLAAHRNLGLGSRLVTEAEAFLSERDYERVALAVTHDNAGAERLYKRLSYVREPLLEDVKCRYDVELSDGSREPAWEVCRVLVKDLRVSNGQDRVPPSPYSV